MIPLMTPHKAASLSEYIQGVLTERNLSNRGFALYAGISEATVRRLLSGEKAEPETLQKLADYLNVPVENLYRLAGYMPETEDDLKTQLLLELEYLMRELPEESQRRLLDMARLEHKYKQEREEAEDDEQEPVRKAS